MPIYSYRCAVCFYEEDVLQKISDPVLTTCPSCQATSFAKKITSAQFRLKGSGWYVTDFRGDTNANGKNGVLSGKENSSAKNKSGSQPEVKDAVNSERNKSVSTKNKKEI